MNVRNEDPCHWRLVDRARLKVQFQLEFRDLWLGLFWRTTTIALHFYICLVPMVPLHITIAREKTMTGQPGRLEKFIVGLGLNWVPGFVVVVIVIAWVITLYGIWVEFTG